MLFRSSGELTEIEGNYDRARVKMAEKRKQWESVPITNVAAPARQPAVSKTAAVIDEGLLLEQIEAQEKAIAALENKMATITDLIKLQELYAEKEELEYKCNQLYSTLEEIS